MRHRNGTLRYEESYHPMFYLATLPRDLHSYNVRCFRGMEALRELRQLKGQFWSLIQSIRQFCFQWGQTEFLGLPYLKPGLETVPSVWAHFFKTGLLRLRDLDKLCLGPARLSAKIVDLWSESEKKMRLRAQIRARKIRV